MTIDARQNNCSDAKSPVLIDYGPTIDQYNAKCWALTPGAGE